MRIQKLIKELLITKINKNTFNLNECYIFQLIFQEIYCLSPKLFLSYFLSQILSFGHKMCMTVYQQIQ
jgi:hypothetical protein